MIIFIIHMEVIIGEKVKLNFVRNHLITLISALVLELG